MSATAPAKSLHLMIHGRVQGVWYRGWMVEEATRLGVEGWVRNRADGRVEAVVAGAPDKVDALVAACREGPPAASVSRIETTETDEVAGPGFQQLPSA